MLPGVQEVPVEHGGKLGSESVHFWKKMKNKRSGDVGNPKSNYHRVQHT
jgi:hypothetical protein